MEKIKYMEIKEFREMGLLAEVNRTFFHPIGMALEVKIDEAGKEYLSGIWDYRGDPEGILYGGPFPTEQVQKAQAFMKEKHAKRKEILGFIYQTEVYKPYDPPLLDLERE